jgi:F0F1-type ATP synthase delta subunit
MKNVKLKNKNLNAKNLAIILENLILQNSAKVVEIINRKEIQSFLPQVLKILERKNLKEKLWNVCEIFSKTNLTDDTINLLSAKFGFKKEDVKVNIDTTMSAGVIIKNGSQYIDATLENYLNKVIV